MQKTKKENNLKLNKLSGPNALIELKGTILTYTEKSWGHYFKMYIPVELISFSEKKRFKGSRLIFALLFLAFYPMIAVSIFLLCQKIVGKFSEDIHIYAIVGFNLIGIIIFIYLLIRFFKREKAMTMHIEQYGYPITFWVDKKQSEEIEKIKNEILKGKNKIIDENFYVMKFPSAYDIHTPWKKTIIHSFLFLTPALILRIKWLFFLVLIPIALHIYKVFVFYQYPKEFRKSLKYYYNFKLEEALNYINLFLLCENIPCISKSRSAGGESQVILGRYLYFSSNRNQRRC